MADGGQRVAERKGEVGMASVYRRYLITFVVPQAVRLDEQRAVIDSDTGRSRWLSPQERAADQAVDYLKTIAATSQAYDMLHDLIERVKPVSEGS